MALPTTSLPSGETVPVLGQGTWNMAEDARRRSDEIASLRLGLDLGMGVIDTAEMYANGRAESLVGASLSGKKKYDEAEPLLLDGYQGMLARKASINVPDRYHLDLAHQWIVQLYQAWGKPAKAADWSRQ